MVWHNQIYTLERFFFINIYIYIYDMYYRCTHARVCACVCMYCMYYRAYQDRLNFFRCLYCGKDWNSSINPSGRYINYKLGTWHAKHNKYDSGLVITLFRKYCWLISLYGDIMDISPLFVRSVVEWTKERSLSASPWWIVSLNCK